MNSSDNTLSLRSQQLFSRTIQLVLQYRYCFFTSLLFGLFSYMFFFTNKLTNIDDVSFLFSKGISLSSGRWGLDILSLVLPDVSMPWFHGITSLLLIASANCLIVSLLKISSRLLQVLTAALLVCFPSITGTFGYMFTSSAYFTALLMSVLSVYFFDKSDWKGALLGIVCCVFSLSIYQSYLSMTVGLMVLVLIRKTMYTDTPCGRIFLRGVYFVLALVLSLVVYMLLTQYLQRSTGDTMNYYANIAFNDLNSLEEILMRPVACIRTLAQILLFGLMGLVHPGIVTVGHLIALAVVGLEIILWAVRRPGAGRIFMLLFLLAVFPFAINCVMLLVSADSIHSLVFYGFTCIYLLIALILDNSHATSPRSLVVRRFRGLLLNITLICMAITAFSNASTANRASFNLHMRYENCYSMATSIITQLEMTPGFTADTPVVPVGFLPPALDFDKLLDVEHITGVSSYACRIWDIDLFFQQFCGVDLNIIGDNEMTKAFIKTPEFQEMPFFPDNGSIREINGTMVLKLDPWMLSGDLFSEIMDP